MSTEDDPLTASDFFHRGVEYLEKGMFQDALDCINAAIERNYFGAEIAMVKGEILFELDNFQDALEWFKRAAQLDDSIETEALLWRGRVFMELDQLGRALSAFNRVIEKHPLPGSAHLYKGQVLNARGDHLKALESLEEAESLIGDTDERLAEVLYWKGRAFNGLNRIGEAVAAYERCLAADPNFIEAFAELGELYRTRGHVEQAIEVLRRGLAQNPDEPSLCNEIGNALRDVGKLEESLEYLNNAISAPIVSSIALFNRALTYERMNRWNEALLDYEAILRETPDDLEAKVRRLEIFSKTEDISRAFEEYDALSPSEREEATARQAFVRFLNRYARKLESEGNVAEVLRVYKLLLDDHPDSLALENPGRQFASTNERYENILKLMASVDQESEWYGLACVVSAPIAFARRTQGNAEAMIRRARELAEVGLSSRYPEYAELCLAEIAFYHDQNPESSLASLQRALELRPDFVAALWLKVTVLMEGHQDIAGAITTYQRVLELSPNNPTVLDSLAQLYLEYGEPYKALRSYRQLIQSAPGDIAIQRELAQCYLALGRVSEAVDELKRLVSRNDQDLELKLDLVDALIKSHAFDEAAEYLADVESANESLNPSVDDTSAELRAALLNHQHLHDQALKALSQIPLEELSDLGLLQKGIALAASGKVDAAADLFVEVVSNTSARSFLGVRSRLELAKAERQQGNLERALQVLRECNEENPYHLRTRALIIWLLRELEDVDQLAREEEELKQFRELEFGRRLLFNEEFAEAVDELRRLTHHHFDFEEAFYWLAAAQCSQGDFNGASRALSRAISLNPECEERARSDAFFEGFAFSELSREVDE